jgi:hypothetical protein
MSEQRTVTIPGCVNHAGYHAVTVTLPWVCATCGGPRGEPEKALSYDGSRRLNVNGWVNACGHQDPYTLVRIEAGVNTCSGNSGWPHG